jgi:hypothetical protein
MRTVQPFRCFFLCALGAFGLSFVPAAPALAAPPAKPPCGTSGPIQVTPISPAHYPYTRGEVGTENFSFTVSSPAVNVTGSCDSSLPDVFGNGSGANPRVLPLAISISAIEQAASRSIAPQRRP